MKTEKLAQERVFINYLLQNYFTFFFYNQIHSVHLGVGHECQNVALRTFLKRINSYYYYSSHNIQPFHSVKNLFQQVLRIKNYVSKQTPGQALGLHLEVQFL